MNKRSSNLKVIEPPADELAAAIAAAAEANAKLKKAEASFTRRFPGDIRLWNLKANWEPEKIEFDTAQGEVFALREDATAAQGIVDQARARVAAKVSETERRAALAVAIGAAADAERSVDNIRASVDRAKAALTSAETKLSEASAAEETARKAKAGRVLEAIEADRAIGTDPSLRQARGAKIEAADEVGFARDALTAVETKLRNVQETLRSERDLIRLCAKGVVASAIPKFLQETIAMHAVLEARRQVLRLIGEWDSGAGGEGIEAYIASAAFPFEQSGAEPEEHAATGSWLAAIEALARDAGAPLPES